MQCIGQIWHIKLRPSLEMRSHRFSALMALKLSDGIQVFALTGQRRRAACSVTSTILKVIVSVICASSERFLSCMTILLHGDIVEAISCRGVGCIEQRLQIICRHQAPSVAAIRRTII